MPFPGKKAGKNERRATVAKIDMMGCLFLEILEIAMKMPLILFGDLLTNTLWALARYIWSV
jgi:hypothetical protein